MTDPWGLTERQAEILSLTIKHGVLKRVAAELCLSIRTIEGHIRLVRKKMGVRNVLLALLNWDRWEQQQKTHRFTRG